MHVYVNPQNGEADEWEIPAGGEVRMMVVPKKSTNESELPEVPAGFKHLQQEQI